MFRNHQLRLLNGQHNPVRDHKTQRQKDTCIGNKGKKYNIKAHPKNRSLGHLI